MTNRFPLIVDSVSQTIKELPIGDNLDLTGSGINGGTIDGTVIGGTTPAAISGTTGTFSGNLTVDTNTLFVDAANNRVGIGTSSPQKSLVVSDGGAMGIELSPDDAGQGYSRILNFDRTTSQYEPLYIEGEDLRFSTGTSAVERMRIDSGGNVLCGSDGGGDIGSSTKRFKDLYLSGGAYIGGTGAANYLDDYEEGTFTPTLTYATPGTLSITLATQSGRYTKIGNVCHYTVDIRLTSFVKGTASGDLIVGNFPFSSANYGNFNRSNAVPSLYQWPYQTNAGYHPFFGMRSDGQPLGELFMSVSNGVNVAISDPDGDSMLFLTGWYYTA